MAPCEREKPKILRCAIYTRKSSEEGLEQDFNSLHAQREACEAYVLSQRHEGWQATPEHYDDGGFSGGTMERPALQRLLNDARSRRIDVVVVYKVDRLTRALTDFGKIVEVFDAHGVSFVSVTQQFNTTTSMGRLTLNVLLSFAQFEREVTGERIRDKIAASKKKGMWMGGVVPLGYDAKDRALVINEADAEIVREIFRAYLRLGTVQRLQDELNRRGIRTKHYVTAAGRVIGDKPFSRGHLYKLLSNPIYLGEIQHRSARYPGLHSAIIDRETWDAVQVQLATNARARDNGTVGTHPSLLAGLMLDSEGNRFVTTHATKNGKRYRYYVGASAEDGNAEDIDAGAIRFPAGELETLVVSAIVSALRDERSVLNGVAACDLLPADMRSLLATAAQLANAIEAAVAGTRRVLLSNIIERISVTRNTLQIHLRSQVLLRDRIEGRATTDEIGFMIECPVGFLLRDARTALVVEGIRSGADADKDMDPAHVKAIARGFVWFEELIGGRARSVREIAKREGLTDRYVSHLINRTLSFAETAIQAETVR